MSGFNGSGVYVISGTGLPYVPNTTISSTVANTLNSNLATGLSTTICRDGQTTVTADIPFAGFKLTGVGAGTAATDAANLGQVQNTTPAYAAAGGTGDAITAAFSPAVTTLTDGMLLRVKAGAANTIAAPTFQADSTTAHTITKFGGQALGAGDIYGAGHELLLQYSSSGTRWELLNPSDTGYLESIVLVGSAVTLGSASPADITSISLTPGEWDVSGMLWTQSSPTTVTASVLGWVSATSATVPTAPAGGLVQLNTTATAGVSTGITTGTARFSVATPTTVYVSMRTVFSVDGQNGYGMIRARRVK